MSTIFKKLSLASAQTIHVVSAPDSFEPELEALEGVEVKRRLSGAVSFALIFVQTLREVERTAARLAAVSGDATIWMAYPKGSSKRYRCEFNRDTGWQALGAAGFEPVSQVAIDEDWSALRFRRAEFIKTMRRNPDGALTAVGRKKALAARRQP